ncbi:hypothetical protein BGZ46_008996 [Entomortierella lignicola]|nr:hypothetical protein BGZ46_008996 [Entomortierella lignicola]
MLKPSGNLIRIAASDNAFDTPFHVLGVAASIGSKKLLSFLQNGPGYHFFLNHPNGEILTKVTKVLEEIKAEPAIDTVYDFDLPSVLEAFEKSKSLRAKGKLIIKVAA